MSSGADRFIFSERMRPVADRLYRAIVPTRIVEITRFDKDAERHILDREYAIDLELVLENGMKLIGQEKFREFSRWREARGLPQYSDLTVELYNDPILKSKGDWFNMCGQFYFDGFAAEDESCFTHYVFVDWLQVVFETVKGNISWRTQENRDGRAKASFRYTSFDGLPANCILARSS